MVMMMPNVLNASNALDFATKFVRARKYTIINIYKFKLKYCIMKISMICYSIMRWESHILAYMDAVHRIVFHGLYVRGLAATLSRRRDYALIWANKSHEQKFLKHVDYCKQYRGHVRSVIYESNLVKSCFIDRKNTRACSITVGKKHTRYYIFWGL